VVLTWTISAVSTEKVDRKQASGTQALRQHKLLSSSRPFAILHRRRLGALQFPRRLTSPVPTRRASRPQLRLRSALHHIVLPPRFKASSKSKSSRVLRSTMAASTRRRRRDPAPEGQAPIASSVSTYAGTSNPPEEKLKAKSRVYLNMAYHAKRNDFLDKQQLERQEAFQTRVPRIARIGTPSCPSFPWCEFIPIPPPTNYAPPDVPLPFRNLPSGETGGSSSSSSSAGDATTF